MTNTNMRAESFDFNQISWKSYNSIKKKAMEQKFSWSGLLVSLSIAFFIVVACAQGLNLIHESVLKAQARREQINDQLYRLESFENNKILETANYIHKNYINSNKLRYLPQINLTYNENYIKTKNYSAKINNAEKALS
ncbi:MAG: hypothetical protein ABIA02_02590 [Candidatus Falkowbacteria bacterium]